MTAADRGAAADVPGDVLRVCLVDDQTLVRQGISGLLGVTGAVEVIAEAADGAAAVAAIEADRPDVVLLDLRMPGRDGIWVLRTLRERGIEVPVLVLTTFDDDELVLQAVRAGAAGYLLKDVTLDQLVGAVRTLAAGGTLVQPAITERLLRAVRAGAPPEPAPGMPELTDRERDVLRLLAGGYANREIAAALFLAEGTVKNHVSSVLCKLGVRDRTSAVLRALQHGLLG
ncbi:MULTISPECIES: response regulator transcription factor [Catenuloplanes]|uniref:DNA-binding NarL/FixJ family response regulator n=1 Tax=Catenuloplanes niger TaxID=587534 RepID=A0AAE3ZHH6_9ACTN|nr:response regulator transcription factor [Catenuloplanes niger]MDR7320062.1 DNA-binding NarL/FixJ family response regulator [Catenuloplanes niger]